MTKLFFFIGFMGSGKSTLGHIVADSLGLTFLDLEDWVEKREGKAIRDIFEEKGEAYFRQLESALLKGLEFLPDARYVVATGGGTPCFEDNMQWMNAHGTTFYLKPELHVLAERLSVEAEIRPLLKGVKKADIEDFIQHLLYDREVWYTQADHILTGEFLQQDKLIELIQRLI